MIQLLLLAATSVASHHESTAAQTVPSLAAGCALVADRSDAKSRLAFAQCLLAGQGMERNAIRAREVLTPLAMDGDSDAAIILGKLYWNGDGIPKDNAVAGKWWRLAHAAGNPEAPLLLGQEAFVRLVKMAPSPDRLDRDLLSDTMSLYEEASRIDPSVQGRALALTQLRQLRSVQDALARQR